MNFDAIESEKVRAFAWRTYNTFIAVVFPVLAGAVLMYFNDHALPVALTSFLDMGLWDYAIGSVLLTLLGSSVAGYAKAQRVAAG